MLKTINKGDEADITPLHYAVRYGHVNVVKLLSELGAGEQVKYFIIFTRTGNSPVLVVHKIKVDQYFNIDLLTDISKPGEDGASPLHYAARFHTNTVRQSGSRYSSHDSVADGEINPVVAPVTTALTTDNIAEDVNHSYGMQVSGINFNINGLLVLLA